MRNRRSLAFALAPMIAVVALTDCRGGGEQAPAENPRLAELRREHEALHDSLEVLVAGDSLLREAAADTGEVVLALRETLMESLIQEVTKRYLDRVELHLKPEVHVEEGGEIKVKALLAKINAGAWKVNLTIHEIRGVLRARPPQVSITGTNRLRLVVPVRVEEGHGAATIHFTWDAKSVANVVCRDFETTQRITGRVMPREYSIDGDFVLAATEKTVVATPEFPEEKFRLSVDMSDESWNEARRTLQSQDKIFKCGIALKPDEVIVKLRELGRKGFNIKLPRSIFRPVELPASVSESVEVEDRRVALAVRPNALRVTPNKFWYSAAVQTAIGDARPDSITPPPQLQQPGEDPSAPPTAGAPGGVPAPTGPPSTTPVPPATRD